MKHNKLMEGSVRQDPAEENMELVSAQQKSEIAQLTGQLSDASNRAAASLRLLDSVVTTVIGLAQETSQVATQAFDLTATVEGLTSRVNRVMRELRYVKTETVKGEPAAMGLLAQQLTDIAKELQILVDVAEDEEIQEMRDLGEEEREGAERRREREHHARTIFRGDD